MVHVALTRHLALTPSVKRILEQARQLLDILDGLEEDDAGYLYAWDGQRIPW